MKVLKFGGTSVNSAGRIKSVIAIVKSSARKDGVVCVVSAFGSVTEKLIAMSKVAASGQQSYFKILAGLKARHQRIAAELIGKDKVVRETIDLHFSDLHDLLHGAYLTRELTLRLSDLIMSYGERLSAFIISKGLRAAGIAADYVDASLLVKTDDSYGAAIVDFEVTNQNIRAYFKKIKGIPVVTGFIASTEYDRVTTLGRSGSDYTAAIFAAALDCSEIEIWTDVNGVMTADPRAVAAAFPIDSLSYDEAMEMSHFGSKVIHPKAMQPALGKNIPLRIRNTFQPDFAGTVISRQPAPNPFVIRGISSIGAVSLLQVQGSGMLGVTGISGRLFGALARESINVILITQASSEHSICFAVNPDFAKLARRLIEKEFAVEIRAALIERVRGEDDMAVVAIVGENMRGVPGIAAKIFQALGAAGINVVAIAQGSSELNVSIVVSGGDEAAALNVIHAAFFANAKTTLHLFVVGVGLVGAELLQQMRKQFAVLQSEHALELKLHGVANSRKMVFERAGLSFRGWKKSLSGARTRMNMARFVEQMKAFNFRNSVFVDCTASEEVVAHYETILNLGIAIVTPNKKANAGSYERYCRLKQASAARGAKFYYETNVGAGLPVIGTLQDLVLSGDTILKIEAIISGSMSFIFNSFDGFKPFSAIVRAAGARGYLEPDPRDDLNGMDLARKLLILAREAGRQLEPSDIALENILPKSCREAKSVDAFWQELEKADAHFDSLRLKAEKEGKRLRYIATLDRENARVALAAVAPNHPFFQLKGSENVISFTTLRYRELPLVIRGRGAGADVTAAGVLADIIRVGLG